MSSHVQAPYQRALIRMAAAAVAWGAGGAAAALIFRAGGLGPIGVSFWRLAVATAFAPVLGARRPAATPARRWPAAAAGLGMAASQTAYFASVRAAGLALSTLVTLGGAVVFVVLGGRLFLREPVNRRGLTAAVVAVAGLLAVVGTAGAGPDPGLGLGLALLAAATYASVTLVGRATGGAATTALTFAVGTAGLLPLAAAEGLWPRELAVTLPALAFLGIVGTALAYRWYFVALATVPAVPASVVTLLEPATATLLAVALLGERLSARAVLGSVTIVAAAVSLARERG